MSDLIRREDAIKALCDAVDNKGDYEGEWLYTDEFCKAIDSVPSADNEVIGKLKTAIENEEICKNCPTTERIFGENLLGAMALGFSYGMDADRPQEWIPCSERLPRPYTAVLVCDECGWISLGSYRPCDVTEKNSGWSTLTRIKIPTDGIIAWMPLPQPWKGADDDISFSR